MGFDITLAIIAGFSAGCMVTTFIAIHLYTSQQKVLEERAENRRIVVNTIGKLCATIENAFSAYRIGTMNFDSLREVLLARSDEINTTISSNIEYLDSYYVKNMERFLEDQKAFILRNQGDLTGIGARTVRSVSRTAVQESKGAVQPPPPSFAPPERKSVRAVPPPPREAVQVPVFEKPAPAPVEMDKTVEIPKKPAPEPAETEQKDYKDEALSAFELGVTTRIPLDAIRQYQQQEEEKVPSEEPPVQDTSFSSVAQTQILDKNTFETKEPPAVPQFDTEPPAETGEGHPVKGRPVFESALDVEATQEFNVNDLMEKVPSRFAPLPKDKEPIQTDTPIHPSVQKPGGADDVFEVNLSKGPAPSEGKPAPPKKKGAQDDSLITGEDVMDQMDNFFGFSE